MSAASPELACELGVLARLDRTALAERWVLVFGCPPPRSCQVPLLRGALAWQLQMQAHAEWRGAAAPARLARSLRTSIPPVTLAPGTRLLREWQGRTHQVTVAAKGFEYDGHSYRSLTAIARVITGTPWSGPLFFGLRT
ncbi:MAG: DUF2924 domain-containing protein [Rubrivivax sp.]